MSEIHDLIIIGAGPSALTAAIYSTRENINTILIEKGVVGGLMATIDKIENYPGFPEGVEGLTLAMDFQTQAEKFGAKIELAEVQKLKKSGDLIIVTTDTSEFQARTVLIASGGDHRKLNIPGESEYAHYCATCDGAFYRDKKLVVIGGANSAIQEAMFLTKFAAHIDLVARSEITASEILQKKLEEYVSSGKITPHIGWTPDEIVATDGRVTSITMHKTDAPDEKQNIKTDGVFIFAGIIPNTKFLTGSDVELDGSGHIITNQDLMTNVPGIFASGDVRSGATKQVSSACGEGTTAAIAIREYLNKVSQN
ncbi:FAD-dependent oxidoreductase [Candidatus Saccharibacteria bacterium]|nr:FAD-dependent oxidoreductase [Candidatus Saccharibacteria bacterium]